MRCLPFFQSIVIPLLNRNVVLKFVPVAIGRFRDALDAAGPALAQSVQRFYGHPELSSRLQDEDTDYASSLQEVVCKSLLYLVHRLPAADLISAIWPSEGAWTALNGSTFCRPTALNLTFVGPTILPYESSSRAAGIDTHFDLSTVTHLLIDARLDFLWPEYLPLSPLESLNDLRLDGLTNKDLPLVETILRTVSGNLQRLHLLLGSDSTEDGQPLSLNLPALCPALQHLGLDICFDPDPSVSWAASCLCSILLHDTNGYDEGLVLFFADLVKPRVIVPPCLDSTLDGGVMSKLERYVPAGFKATVVMSCWRTASAGLSSLQTVRPSRSKDEHFDQRPTLHCS